MRVIVVRRVVDRWLADRGTHLAAMIAYFALLAFVPMVFIAISLLGLLGQQTESSYLIRQLEETFPQSSVADLERAVGQIQDDAGPLSALGIVGLLWSSLGLFSVLESTFNIVYRVPNRRFAHGKGLALGLMAAALVVLFVGLVAGSVGVDLANRAGVGRWLAYLVGIAISTALLFVFVWSAYRLIPNAPVGWRETLPGALAATAALEASFQLVPVFVRATGGVASLQAFGGLLVLLVWLYLMANVLVLGAELNAVLHER
jgi:membrane protein